MDIQTDAEIAIGKNPGVYCNTMRADVDGDGNVTILDFSRVAVYYTSTVPPAPARYDQGLPPRDNRITILDFSAMALRFGQSRDVCVETRLTELPV